MEMKGLEWIKSKVKGNERLLSGLGVMLLTFMSIPLFLFMPPAIVTIMIGILGVVAGA